VFFNEFETSGEEGIVVDFKISSWNYSGNIDEWVEKPPSR